MSDQTKKFSWRRFAALSLLLPLHVTAQPETPPTPPTMQIQSARPSNSSTSLEINAGAGQYPVLQVPTSPYADSRIDGTVQKADLSSRSGTLLGAHLGWSKKLNLGELNVKAGGERIASMIGSQTPTPASYSRLDAMSSLTFDLASLNDGLSVSPGLGARRSMFRNIDSGHYVDSVIFSVGAAQKMGSFSGMFDVGYAPWTRFGYTQNTTQGSSGPLASTRSSLWTLMTGLVWQPNPITDFFVRYEEEEVAVTMQDIGAYRAYGLPAEVDNHSSSERNFVLTTRSIAIGATKRF